MPVSISADLITGIVSFLLTVMVLSYLIWGDNPAFRVTVYIFVGVSAGYVAAVTWWQVLYPKLIRPLTSGDFSQFLLPLIALILGVLLLMKLSPRTAILGNSPIAFLVGVGAAVAVGGAVMGTLIPQTQATINVFDLSKAGQNWFERLFFATVMLIGTVTTLVYFHFGAKSTPAGPRQNKLLVTLGWVGQVFIAITLGVLFAGVFAAAMTALIERLSFIWSFFTSFL
jgi:hypothetical protein